MSALSSTSSSEIAPVGRLFPLALLAGALLSFGLYFGLVWVIDPYGISPIRIEIAGINAHKPKRIDIDRLIKPIEVWQHQPRTVFLGTSRIHQSIDPSVMDGTDFAPAYNASVPAVALAMNISYLEHYAVLDGNLRTAVAELFFYYFVGQGQFRTPVTMDEFVKNAVALNVSIDAARDAIVTLVYNAGEPSQRNEIGPGGNLERPAGIEAYKSFEGFPKAMWDLYKQGGGHYELHQPAFDAVADFVRVAKERNVDLILLITPNHAYFDYFIEMIGAWDLVEDILSRLAAIAPIYSFSQPNAWVYEEVGPGMVYWHDPFHFSLEMGRGMQMSLLGKELDGLPSGFLEVLTPADVPAHVASRREAIRLWAEAHPAFVKEFADERQKAGF